MVSPLASIVSGLGPQATGYENLGQNIQNMELGNQQRQMNQQRMQMNQSAMNQQKRQLTQEDASRQIQFINRLGKQLLNQDESRWTEMLRPHLPALEAMGYTPEVLQGMTRDQVQDVVMQTDSAMQPKQGAAQFGAQETFKDEEGNLYFGTQKRNPQTGEVQSSLSPIGNAPESPIGRVSITGGYGLTADEKTGQAVAEAGGKKAAEIGARIGATDEIAESEAAIAQRKKFGELTASSRSKAIDSGFERVTGIQKNIQNIDRAIQEIDNGANTGRIESAFFPSLKAATLKLEQIQGELALDVVGATTFGALSKGELDLAKDVALPTGLQPDELKTYLLDKKAAQEKLLGYFEEQIDFLDQGGTVAGFLRKKKREQPKEPAQQESVNIDDLINKYAN